MGVDVHRSVVIDRPPVEVAAVAFDPARDPEWIGGVRTSRPLAAGPIGVGARVERTAAFLGRRITYVNEVVELEPGRRLRMRSVSGPFPMRITYELAPAGAGTNAAIRVEGEAARFFRLADPLLRSLVGRSVGRDLRRLRDLLEGGRAAG